MGLEGKYRNFENNAKHRKENTEGNNEMKRPPPHRKKKELQTRLTIQLEEITQSILRTHSVTVTILKNGHGDMSSNHGGSCLYYT